MEKREVEIKEVKTTTEWYFFENLVEKLQVFFRLILEQRVYLLRTFRRKNEGEELLEITEVERRY